MKIYNAGGEKAYAVAAEEFAKYYNLVTGKKAEITKDLSADVIICGKNFELADADIRDKSDDFAVVSKDGKLVITGANGRAALYGVYAYFEDVMDCHWFWDGDAIKKADEIVLDGVDIHEKPRFEYRMIRYFAHRGLHRFQAEHWDFEDWKREIDWLLKRRMNTFMLRIGVDDLFQKAFPDVVSYPSNEEVLPEATDSYNNRTTFWSLKYRGELRKKVLDYAFDRGLLHPEDCGTMTHWYSRTPLDFLNKVKPTLLNQVSKSQSEQTGLVWDIYDDKNLKNYQKLTDTHVKEHGRPDIFHTIGLAERTYSDDREKGLAMKKDAYDKITAHIAGKYPDAPLMIASWDFFYCYQPDEVRRLMKTFDPNRHIILDYTLDLKWEENNFEQWDMIGKMPWIFGLFHGYQPQSHVHGDYEYIDKKLKIADDDEFCKGMAFWPELSHSDTFMLDYFTESAWKPQYKSLEDRADRFCEKRYGDDAETLKSIWQAFLPVFKLPSRNHMSCFFTIMTHGELKNIMDKNDEKHAEKVELWTKNVAEYKKFLPAMKETLEKIAALPKELFEKDFVCRDMVDLVRTIMVKKLHYDFMEAALKYNAAEDKKSTLPVWENCLVQLELYADILAMNEEYSIYHTVEGLKKVTQYNPHFNDAIKDNIINWYCRSSVYEAVTEIYIPEVKVYINEMMNRKGDAMPDFEEAKAKIFADFKEKSLESTKPEKTDYREVCKKFADFIKVN